MCHTVMLFKSFPTNRQHSELVGLAEGTLRADVHMDCGKAEVVSSVIWLCFGYVQVPCYLRYKPAAIVLLDEIGKFVDKPTVRER